MDIDSIIAQWDQYLRGLYTSGKNVPLPPSTEFTPIAPAPLWINGMSQPDWRGFVKIQEIEAERAADSHWANVCEWYDITDILTTFTLTPAQHLNVEANLVECAAAANSAAMGDHAFDMSTLNPCYAMSPPNRAGATYTRGAIYPDALAFPGGFVGRENPTIADIRRFIETCNATGNLPIISPANNGVVAG